MSAQVLNILKYFLLALVWLFFLRVLRVVWVEMRSGDAVPVEPAASAPRAGVVPARRRSGQATIPPAVPALAPAVAPPIAPAAPPPSGLPRRLRVVDPADRVGEQYSLVPRAGRTETVLGRANSADVPLGADSFVSSRHARVFMREGTVWIEDLGSTNGTVVNGTRISGAVELHPGDRVQVGRTTLEADP